MAREDAIGLARQTALGTPNTVVGYWMPVETADPGASRETLEADETLGNRFPTGIEYGTIFHELELAGVVRLNSFPRLLSAFFGDPVTSATADVTAKKHLFAAQADTPQPLSVFVHRVPGTPNPTIEDRLTDVLGNELTIGCDVDDFLRFEAGMIARAMADPPPAAPTVTSDLSRRFAFHRVECFLTVSPAAEIEIPVAAWSMTYSNGIDTDDRVLGQQTLYSLEEGNAGAEIMFRPRTTIDAWYRRALLVEPESVKVRLLATGAVIGTGVSQTIEVIAHAMETVEAPVDVDAGETVKSIEVSGRVKYNDAGSNFVDVAVTNAIASYAT